MENFYDDNLEFLSSLPLSFNNFGLKKIKKISCNSKVCHAITMGRLVFSWGIDSNKIGLLALGEQYYIKIPQLNPLLTKVSVQDISLSQDHCAAIDGNNNLYTWGLGINGQLGQRVNFACNTPKKIVLNMPFFVKKVECGNGYTCGIDESNRVFYFGKIADSIKGLDIDEMEKKKDYKGEKDDIELKENKMNFIRLDGDNKASDIFCGENIFAVVSKKGELYIYSETQGLFKVQLNAISNIYIKNEIKNAKFIDKTLYALTKDQDLLFEFINYTSIKDNFDIYNYTQTEYIIDTDIRLNLLQMPYFVKALFFCIKCSSRDKEDYTEQKRYIFQKVKNASIDNQIYQCDNTSRTNNNVNVSNGSKTSKISNMLGNIFEKKIEEIENKNKVIYCEKNNERPFRGKKRIKLIPIDYMNADNNTDGNNENMKEKFIINNVSIDEENNINSYDITRKGLLSCIKGKDENQNNKEENNLLDNFPKQLVNINKSELENMQSCTNTQNMKKNDLQILNSGNAYYSLNNNKVKSEIDGNKRENESKDKTALAVTNVKNFNKGIHKENVENENNYAKDNFKSIKGIKNEVDNKDDSIRNINYKSERNINDKTQGIDNQMKNNITPLLHMVSSGLNKKNLEDNEGKDDNFINNKGNSTIKNNDESNSTIEKQQKLKKEQKEGSVDNKNEINIKNTEREAIPPIIDNNNNTIKENKDKVEGILNNQSLIKNKNYNILIYEGNEENNNNSPNANSKKSLLNKKDNSKVTDNNNNNIQSNEEKIKQELNKNYKNKTNLIQEFTSSAQSQNAINLDEKNTKLKTIINDDNNENIHSDNENVKESKDLNEFNSKEKEKMPSNINIEFNHNNNELKPNNTLIKNIDMYSNKSDINKIKGKSNIKNIENESKNESKYVNNDNERQNTKTTKINRNFTEDKYQNKKSYIIENKNHIDNNNNNIGINNKTTTIKPNESSSLSKPIEQSNENIITINQKNNHLNLQKTNNQSKQNNNSNKEQSKYNENIISQHQSNSYRHLNNNNITMNYENKKGSSNIKEEPNTQSYSKITSDMQNNFIKKEIDSNNKNDKIPNEQEFLLYNKNLENNKILLKYSNPIYNNNNKLNNTNTKHSIANIDESNNIDILSHRNRTEKANSSRNYINLKEKETKDEVDKSKKQSIFNNNQNHIKSFKTNLTIQSNSIFSTNKDNDVYNNQNYFFDRNSKKFYNNSEPNQKKYQINSNSKRNKTEVQSQKHSAFLNKLMTLNDNDGNEITKYQNSNNNKSKNPSLLKPNLIYEFEKKNDSKFQNKPTHKPKSSSFSQQNQKSLIKGKEIYNNQNKYNIFSPFKKNNSSSLIGKNKIPLLEEKKIEKIRNLKERAKNNSLEKPPTDGTMHKRSISTSENQDSLIVNQQIIKSDGLSGKKVELIPKELEENAFSLKKPEISNNIHKSAIYNKLSNENNDINQKDTQLKLSDLEVGIIEGNSESIKQSKESKLHKVIKVKNKEEFLQLLNQESEKDISLDDSIYYFIEGDVPGNLTDIQEEEESLIESQNNPNKNSQLIKVKKKKVTVLTNSHHSVSNIKENEDKAKQEEEELENPNNNRNNQFPLNEYYSKDNISYFKRKNDSNEPFDYSLFSGEIEDQYLFDKDILNNQIGIYNIKPKKTLTQLYYSSKKKNNKDPLLKKSGNYNSKHSQNQINNNSKPPLKTMKSNMPKANDQNSFLKSAKSIKNLGIISQSKQNLNQKKLIEQIQHQRNMIDTHNLFDIKNKNSQEPIKSKINSVRVNKREEEGKDNPLQLIINKEKNYNKLISKTPKNKKTISFDEDFINRSDNYPITKKKDGKNNKIVFKILKEKYIDFLKKNYNINEQDRSKEDIEKDENFLHALVNNQMPIENSKFSKMGCSKEMEKFILNNLNDNKMMQIKENLERAKYTEDNPFGFDTFKSNAFRLIQLDYEEEIKDRSNLLEPMELDRSIVNFNFKKSFIDLIKNSTFSASPSKISYTLKDPVLNKELEEFSSNNEINREEGL